MEIHKCDRCKCIIEEYVPILFQGINQNETKEIMHPLLGPAKEFYNKTWELCTDCATQVFRWLAHQENELKNENKGRT